MKLFLDTNVLIDIVAGRNPWVKQALVLLELSKQDHIELVAADFSFINMAYILRKAFTTKELCTLLQDLKKYIHVVPIGDKTLSDALNTQWADIEDAVQSLIAKREKADYIITRNEKDFSVSTIPAISPASFINQYL